MVGEQVISGVDPRAHLDDDYFDVVVERGHGLRSLSPRELIAYRELLYFLTLRDLKVRYKQTALGVGWSILQPVLSMIIFTIVFGHVAKLNTGGIPYPIFSFSALLPWYLFANSVQLSSNSLVGSTQLITKVYFPRIFVVTSPILGGCVDFLLSAVVLAGLMVYYAVPPSIGLVTVPAFLLLILIVSLGVSALLAALNVRYRDVRFVVPFLMQLWLFTTPVVYSLDSLHEPWKTLFGLNPMTAPVLAFRWAFAGGLAPSASIVVLSVVTTLLIGAAGLVYFAKTEKSFADVI
jgi:lipopolysaccharide transport system permease protein